MSHDFVVQECAPSDYYSVSHGINRGQLLVFSGMLASLENARLFALMSIFFWGWLEDWAQLELSTRVPMHGLSSVVASRWSEFLNGNSELPEQKFQASVSGSQSCLKTES